MQQYNCRGNSFRVSGTLAVSRAIGDAEHKPFVTAEPDIEVIDLDGQEDFIVLACVSRVLCELGTAHDD